MTIFNKLYCNVTNKINTLKEAKNTIASFNPVTCTVLVVLLKQKTKEHKILHAG